MSDNKKTEKWLDSSIHEIINSSNFPQNNKDAKFLEKFLEMGIPVLKKYKSGRNSLPRQGVKLFW